jgi:ABC-type lipoprotein release transport system permease subunit
MDRAFENKRIIIRAVISGVVLGTIVLIVYMLFRHSFAKEIEVTLNVVIGALLASYHKVIEFWFKRDTDDSDHDALKPPSASATPSRPSL